MDIWVERTVENYEKLKAAFYDFGMPMFDMTEDSFLNHPIWDVFTFGNPPSSIDIMVRVKGMAFEACYSKAIYFEEDSLPIKTIFLQDLINAKRASGRAKDINDLENLGGA
ncbi:hypothetical protein MuYL_0348 [Mucilaginibacter xinganensis]|uniref:Uncharacterized protein n=2 Tax=Mucilaginibacter xinganensis TaxID=1234841 RepID=A0A223NRX8_9SPHI|nr:hypothetical protein MuYL_0348 [Mucilaginibacter xinganensis]